MVCGKHKPTAQCSIRGKRIEVCPTCYYTLGLWSVCPEKPWGEPMVKASTVKKEEEKLREIEKLLEKLG